MIHESVSIKKKPYLAVTKRYGMSSLHAIRCNKLVLEIQGVVKVESVLVSACGGGYPDKLMTRITNLKAATAPSRWRAIQCARENSYRKSGFLKLREVLRRADATFTNRRSWRREGPRPQRQARARRGRGGQRNHRTSRPTFSTFRHESHRSKWDGTVEI